MTRMTEWIVNTIIDMVPRRLALVIAERFWLFAYAHTTDAQSNTFLEVLDIGASHWGEYAPEDDNA